MQAFPHRTWRPPIKKDLTGMMNNGYLLLVSTIKWLHEAKSINNFPKDSTLKRLYINDMWSKAGSLVT